MKKYLSAVILFKNEEEFLPLTVAACWDYVDELVLIDSKSTDLSFKIANELQHQRPKVVKLHQFDADFDTLPEWKSRNKSLKLCSGQWIAMLDADQILSDGWRKEVQKFMDDRKCESVGVQYRHAVGSTEYTHPEFKERQENPALHPEIPLYQTVFFRNTNTLRVMPAAWSCPQFREFHHSRADESVHPDARRECSKATVIHTGFSKRNMMAISRHRINRGDYGHDPVVKAQMIEEMERLNNPFRFVGPVVKVTLPPEEIPWPIKDKHGKDYELTLNEQGFIMQRKSKTTGEIL